MRHHYWEWTIPAYLFLGGLGGGVFCLTMIMTLIVGPTNAAFTGQMSFVLDVIPAVLTWPCFIAMCALALGCVFLVLDLGQPLVFYRAFVKSTSVLAWGARLLTVTLIFGLLWWVSYVPWDWFKPVADFFVFFRPFNILIAGLAGAGVMLYTGVFLSTLKARMFWATPALPVLFTISALSTACALITLSCGWWPAQETLVATMLGAIDYTPLVAEYVDGMLHTLDIILVVCEIVVLLVMVLSFLGAGNKTANKAAHRWIHGSYAGWFWLGVMGIGLVFPEALYLFGGESFGATIVAPVFVLIGGCILRFLITYSDDRAPLPGEDRYFNRLVGNDALFIHRWVYGKNEF